ncbi:hypothetical protein EDC23_0422 [Thiohalophilus thiocyanatoxydans]|uniref:Uncharacterized protein n=1 Tax=Thiohalophilus thiocyanatoxydans TaxID=381308 RepID=A0A4R8IX02_9GAMM|nr:hypothetical protein EDC23_0422 [Thiohalophilus thiocyanatoxydans]
MNARLDTASLYRVYEFALGRGCVRQCCHLTTANCLLFYHWGQSQAAPRTPLESPCFGGTSLVSTRSEKT